MIGRHEHKDANVRRLTEFGVGLAVLVVVAMIAMGFLFRFLAGQTAPGPEPSPFAEVKEPAPEPRLQVTPATDVEQQRAADRDKLNSYGWVDRDSGLVRIPIERAMDLVAERGLGGVPTEEGSR